MTGMTGRHHLQNSYDFYGDTYQPWIVRRCQLNTLKSWMAEKILIAIGNLGTYIALYVLQFPFNCILDVYFRLRLPISSILCSIIWFLNIYLRNFFVFSKLLKLLKKTVTEWINTHKKFKILFKNAQNKTFSNCLDPNLVFLFTENSQHSEEFTKRFPRKKASIWEKTWWKQRKRPLNPIY